MARHRSKVWLTILLASVLEALAGDRADIVAASTKLQYPLTLGATPITLRKIVNPRTGAARLESSHPGIVSFSDLRRYQAEERRATQQRYGSLGRSLQARYDRMRDSDTVRVGIELRMPTVKYLSRFRHTTAELKAQSIALCEVRPLAAPETLVATYGLRDAEVSGQWISCTVTKKALTRLVRDPAVASVFALDPGVPCGKFEPFTKLATAALNPAAHPSDRQGQGVRAAIIEPQTGAHLEQTTACLKNAAPAAQFYHKESTFYTTMATAEWLVTNEIETNSMSISRSADMRTPHEGDFLLMDDFAYRWPCPVFVTPAGNGGFSEEVHWQQYTGISVGSAKHFLEQTYVFDTFTSARNPDPVTSACLGADTTHCGGDRELPELLAPGSHPYEPVGVTDTSYVWYNTLRQIYCSTPENPDSTYPCGYYPTESWAGSGTSYAAPIVNGIAARLISSNRPLLAHRPDAVKMALILTAHNVEGGYWDARVDGRDGAGVVSAYDAVAYAVGCSDLTGQSDRPAVEHGFYTAEANVGMKEQVFRVKTPSDPAPDRHLRVVLVWTSTPDLVTHFNAVSDLDLGAFVSDNGTYGSYSLDATVEMFDVPNSALTPGMEYAFKVLPTDIRIPDGARTDYFYYTVGWTWVRDHADSATGASVMPSRSGRSGVGPSMSLRALSAGMVEVHFSGLRSPAWFRVTDLQGRVVYAKRIPGSSGADYRVRVDLTGVAAGLRVMSVETDDGRRITSHWLGR